MWFLKVSTKMRQNEITYNYIYIFTRNVTVIEIKITFSVDISFMASAHCIR